MTWATLEVTWWDPYGLLYFQPSLYDWMKEAYLILMLMNTCQQGGTVGRRQRGTEENQEAVVWWRGSEDGLR